MIHIKIGKQLRITVKYPVGGAICTYTVCRQALCPRRATRLTAIINKIHNTCIIKALLLINIIKLLV